MTGESLDFIYLAGGGGGGEDDIAAFARGLEFPIHFDTVPYPGWRRYIQEDFSADVFVEELTAEIARRVPSGPIGLLGLSVGGHFAYAAALRLQKQGREIAFFCAIDSFMVASAQPSAGWRRRALSDAFDLIRKRRFKDFTRLLRSKAWRALLRLAEGRLAGILRNFSNEGKVPAVLRRGALAEEELSMRLLLRETAPWIAQLDRDAVPLNAPALLIRTEASAPHDAAWRLRCPEITIREVPGKHLNLFEPEYIGGLRDAFSSALASERRQRQKQR
jgi:thioesterase domain-containing protein